MKHFTVAEFWEHYQAFPNAIKDLADKNYILLKDNSHHPSLHLKKVGVYWSVRVGRDYRALGMDIPEGILWFWIGTHAEYDKII